MLKRIRFSNFCNVNRKTHIVVSWSFPSRNDQDFICSLVYTFLNTADIVVPKSMIKMQSQDPSYSIADIRMKLVTQSQYCSKAETEYQLPGKLDKNRITVGYTWAVSSAIQPNRKHHCRKGVLYTTFHSSGLDKSGKRKYDEKTLLSPG